MLINCLIILILNLVIYRKVVNYGLVVDDAILIGLGTEPFKPKTAKTESLIIHTLVAEFIFVAFGASQASYIAALMFSVHPLTVQVSEYWCGRHYGINALIILMAIAFAPIGGVLYFWSVGTFATAMFTPLMFAFIKNWYLAFICPAIVAISWKRLHGALKTRKERQAKIRYTHPDDFKIHVFRWINLILVVKTFGYYALACLLPIKNGFYNSFLTQTGASEKATRCSYSFDKNFWGGIIAITIMATAWSFNIHNFIGMGILLFVLSIGPYLNFFTVNQWTAPRYAYAALCGYQIALVGLLLQAGIPGYCILSALWLFYLDRMISVSKKYSKDNITLIMEDSVTYPDNPRLWYYRYEHMLHKQMPIMAYAEAAYGLRHLPEDSQLYFGLACASFTLGDIKSSITFLDLSEKYMILCERKSMENLIVEFRQKIKEVIDASNNAQAKV